MLVHLFKKLLDFDGLCDIIIASCFLAIRKIFVADKSSLDDNGDLAVKLSYSFCSLESIHFRHFQIHENKINLVDRSAKLYSFNSVPCMKNLDRSIMQHGFEEFEIDLIILSNYDNFVFPVI